MGVCGRLEVLRTWVLIKFTYRSSPGLRPTTIIIFFHFFAMTNNGWTARYIYFFSHISIAFIFACRSRLLSYDSVAIETLIHFFLSFAFTFSALISYGYVFFIKIFISKKYLFIQKPDFFNFCFAFFNILLSLWQFSFIRMLE